MTAYLRVKQLDLRMYVVMRYEPLRLYVSRQLCLQIVVIALPPDGAWEGKNKWLVEGQMPVAVRELSGGGLVGNLYWSLGQSTIEVGDGGDILYIYCH